MSYTIDIKLALKDIALLSKIFEAYNGLAVITTVDSKKGIIRVNATPQTVSDVREILNNMPMKIEFL